MGTPDGFKPKRMDKEKWKRIIQPDGDSDSSLDCWDDNINGNGNNNDSLSTIRLTHLFGANRMSHTTVNGSDDQQDGQAVPSTNAATVTGESCPGPSSSPDVLPVQIASQHSRIMNLTPPIQAMQLRAPNSAVASTPTVISSSQPSSSSAPSTSQANRTVGAVFNRLAAARQRRVHFQDPISFENRLQRVKERLNQRHQLLRSEPYRHSNPKDPGTYRTPRAPTSPVVSSSLASLRSMMRCGNNPDWLKLSGQNLPHRSMRWLGSSLTTGAGSSSDYTNENWGVEVPPQPAHEIANTSAATSTAASVNSSGNSARVSTVVDAFQQTAAASAPATGAGEAMAQDPLPEADTNMAIHSSSSDTQNIPANNSTVAEDQVQTITSLSDVALNSNILSMLECPVCLEHMGPPIHQCRRGHLVCNNCRGQLLTCPTCRSRFTDLRNLAMERIAEYLHFPCKNEECGQSFKLRTKDEHELNCPWRIYHCMAQSCQWQGLHRNLLVHAQEQHSELILGGEKHRLEMPLDLTFSRNYVFSAWGELFRANMQRGPGGNVIYCLAQYIGPVARAAEFKFTLHLEQNLNVSRNMTYSRTMHSDNIRLSQVYSSGDTFCISAEVAKHFATDLRKTYLQIELEKVPPTL